MKTTLIVGGFVIAIGILLSWNHLFPGKPAALITDPNNLPGIEIGDAPWIPEMQNLRVRLTDVGLPALSSEGSVLHIHQHLDLSINGAPVTVPADIGDAEAYGFIAPVHTHDTSGIIHVESNTVRDFTLGQFFGTRRSRSSTARPRARRPCRARIPSPPATSCDLKTRRALRAAGF
ncbi:MAG: hypothetical protein B7X04_00065 [Parcubacteria group bacterium 21-54-25]|nr:MAG: hypothetical protein B7X04_00065 [Parcubacteria group bacterium 21-54-25]